MVVLLVLHPNFLIGLILLLSLPRLWFLFRKKSDEERRYFEVAPGRRLIMASELVLRTDCIPAPRHGPHARCTGLPALDFGSATFLHCHRPLLRGTVFTPPSTRHHRPTLQAFSKGRVVDSSISPVLTILISQHFSRPLESF